MELGGGSKGITGTDIGWSFEHDGRLVFLFGDTRDFSPDLCEPGTCGTQAHPLPAIPDTVERWPDLETYYEWLDAHGSSPESMASAPLSFDPDRCIRLRVETDPTGRFRPTKLDGRIVPRQEGAFSGFSAASASRVASSLRPRAAPTPIYAFLTLKAWPPGCTNPTGCAHDDTEPGGRTVLARSSDGGAHFHELALFSSTKFQFVAPSVELGSRVPGLPSDLRADSVVLAFGSGREINEGSNPSRWNESYPYLAVCSLSRVGEARTEAWAHELFIDEAAMPFGDVARVWRGETRAGFVGAASRLSGIPLPPYRWLLADRERILAVREDGRVWAYGVHGPSIHPVTEIAPRPPQPGEPLPVVATRPEDKWVLMDSERERILVITEDGRVFAHRITSHVEPAELLSGARVGARPEDRWVLLVGGRLVVITNRGRVFAHDLAVASVGAPRELLALDGTVAGATPPAGPAERWVLGVDDKIVRITGMGEVFVHRVGRDYVDYGRRVPGQQRVGASAHDRWLLVLGAPWARSKRLVAVPCFLTGWRYFAGLDAKGEPVWSSDEKAAAPLVPFGKPIGVSFQTWPPSLDTHRCLGYYSVRLVETLGRWVMLYTCKEASGPRGVYVRTSLAPWGPWTSPVLLWSPADGYCRYMFSALGANDPSCSPNPREEEKRRWNGSDAEREPGGEYAPFLLPSRYAKRLPDGRTKLYFTLSTWNPYQTILLRGEVSVS